MNVSMLKEKKFLRIFLSKNHFLKKTLFNKNFKLLNKKKILLLTKKNEIKEKKKFYSSKNKKDHFKLI
jgi:hypothetical protein